MKNELTRSRQKWLYILAPFCMLLLCLGCINLAVWLRTSPLTPLPATVTAVAPPLPSPTPTISRNLSETPNTSLATTMPSSTATPSPIYTPPPFGKSDIIRLLGPPQNSTFAKSDTISFYWQWPHPLTEDQQFNVYLLAEEEVILLGTVKAPNIGTSYRLSVALPEVVTTADTVQWLVQLETIKQNQPLRVSQMRFFFLFTSTFPL